MTTVYSSADLASLTVHPLAALLPPMADAEYAALRNDIAAHGQRQPIVIHEGMILDGRHRARACQELGIACKFAELPANLSPLEYVLSTNLRRRNVTASQLAMIAARLVTTTGRGYQRAGVVTQAAAAAQVGVSDRYVRDAAWLMGHDAQVAEQVWTGARALGAAVREVRASMTTRAAGSAAVEALLAVEPAAAPAAAVPTGDGMRAALALIPTLDYAEWMRSLSATEVRTLAAAAEFFAHAYDLADEEGRLA